MKKILWILAFFLVFSFLYFLTANNNVVSAQSCSANTCSGSCTEVYCGGGCPSQQGKRCEKTGTKQCNASGNCDCTGYGVETCTNCAYPWNDEVVASVCGGGGGPQPTSPPTPSTGTLLGRILVNGQYTKFSSSVPCAGTVFSQMVYADTTVNGSRVSKTYKAESCNPQPYYTANLNATTYDVYVPTLGGYSVRWTCSSPASGNANCINGTSGPNAFEPGHGLSVKVGGNQETHVWFFYTSDPTTPPVGPTCTKANVRVLPESTGFKVGNRPYFMGQVTATTGRTVTMTFKLYYSSTSPVPTTTAPKFTYTTTVGEKDKANNPTYYEAVTTAYEVSEVGYFKIVANAIVN